MKTLMAIAALLASVSAQAELNGLEMEGWCSDEGSAAYLTCIGYFAGYTEGSSVINDIAEAQNKTINGMFCIEGVDRQVMARVWLKYIEENPEKLELPPRWSIAQAMLESFPCDVES